MSKVMRAIDAKSFIIGVLSAVVVCVAMGAANLSSNISVHCAGLSYRGKDSNGDEQWNYIHGIPFAISDGKVYYYRDK